jgi:S-adenosylmethionine:tRNA ribosyltransferase-isomerase
VTLEFTLPPTLEAHEPPEARGLGRDGVRLLVSSSEGVSHQRFTDLPSLLRAGDVLVVNTSATVPAAVPVPDSPLVVHVSTERPDGTWLVELRQAAAKAPFRSGAEGARYPLFGGGSVTLRRPFSAGRLWESDVDTLGMGVPEYLSAFGRRSGTPTSGRSGRFPTTRRFSG